MHELIFILSGLLFGFVGQSLLSSNNMETAHRLGISTGREIERSKNELMRWAAGEPRTFILQERRRAPRLPQPRAANGTYAKHAV
jgi:hypothetical protein